MSEMNRRTFVKSSAIAATGLTVMPSRVLGANERLNVAVIGCGRMGQHNLSVYSSRKDVNIAAVCDVYEPHLRQAVGMTDGRAATYIDFRHILDRKDIDAVIIAAPDHWHALQTTLACEAGKDVFVEKPASLTVAEGRRMVQVARRTGRIVQVGTMQRSSPVFQNVIKIIEGGIMGPISFVRTWIVGNEYPDGIGNPADEPAPADLDWDLWLGPAPMVAYNINRFGIGDRWSTFRYFWDYAGGMMTDWGVHLIDIVLWAMQAKAPNSVMATGGKFYLRDNRDTPDTLHINYQFDKFVLTFSNQVINDRGIDGQGYGIEFYGANASLFVDRGGYRIMPQEGGRFDRKALPDGLPLKFNSNDSGNDAHAANFIDCIKTRQLPISDIEIGHRSTSICLLGNIAYRIAARLEWDAEKEVVLNNDQANALLSYDYRAPWKLPEA
ncbi:Gfo/Idh/MocA family oxidoreductase [candidate division KSB1 bacterium]|nr:Gfo/Idh/MocA family oxidoreductase [candidate division KSB1 bacterium]RQW03345.1 MAG: gfo/Idh/MocA family oxidoreductase [candidate division KSB1 bacterium]